MNQLQQNLAELISPRGEPLNQIWYKSIRLGKCVKYNVTLCFFCLYVLFWELAYKLDPLSDFHKT